MAVWLVLLWACSQAPDDAEPSSTETDAVSDTEAPPSTLDQALCDAGDASEDPYTPDPTSVTEQSPFGTGLSESVGLGPLEDPSLLVETPTGDNVDYDWDLDLETFNVYVPADYDGSEAYGLLVHIDAGDVGRMPGDWAPAMDAERVIVLAANGVGNPENVDRRMGLSVLGAARMLELFHIDQGRVWATGTSGGGRSSTMMAYLHPDTFAGAMPLCGSAFVAQVDQDYETHEPDGHYEFWGSSYFPRVDGRPYDEFLLEYGQRFALLTSFEDFREGDLFNIYHHGLEPYGWDARLLETTGSHCATTPEQAFDALAFLQHPTFAHDTSDWWTDGATTDGSLTLEAGGQAALQARLVWDDTQGLITRSTWQLDLLDGGALTQRIVAYQGDAALSAFGTLPGFSLTVRNDTVTLSAEDGTVSTVLVEGTVADGEALTDVFMKGSFWSDEVQINLGLHLDPDSVTASDGAMLLNDQRTLRVRLDERDPLFADGTWDEGAVWHFSATGPAIVEDLSVVDAVGLGCN